MLVKDIRERLGLSRAEFAEKFQVSKRTLECWEYETRTPPPHVMHMLEQILELEEQVHALKDEVRRLRGQDSGGKKGARGR